MKQTKFLLALLMISAAHDSMATAPINETQPLLVEEQKLDTMLNLNRNRKELKKDWKRLTEPQIKQLAREAADRGENSKKLNETLHDIFSSGCCSGSKLPKAAEDFLDEVARIQAERSKTPPPSDLALHPVFVFNRADGAATVSSSSSNLEQVSTPQTQNRPRSRSVSFADFQRSLSPAPIVSQQQSTNSDFVTQDQVEKAITATSEKFLAEIQRVRSASQGRINALQEQVKSLSQSLEKAQVATATRIKEITSQLEIAEGILAQLQQEEEVHAPKKLERQDDTDSDPDKTRLTELSGRIKALEDAIRLDQAKDIWTKNGIARRIDFLSQAFRALNALANSHYQSEYADLLKKKGKE